MVAPFENKKSGVAIMTNLSIASVARIDSVEVAGDQSFKIALVCCIGLMASLCVVTFGIDIGAAWL